MKKLFAIAAIILATLIASCALAQDNIVYRVYDVEQYLETFEVQPEWHEVCRSNGDDYNNATNPEPLKINMVDGEYIIHFRHEDPSDLSRWSAIYIKPGDIIIRREEGLLQPTIQEVSVAKYYRFSDTREDIGKPLQLNRYLLTVPADTIFE